MIRFIFLGTLLLGHFSCLAQFTDDFSDGDFSNNPSWSGDTDHFEVNSSAQLHLKSDGSDTSVLYTVFSLAGSLEWRFYVKQSFNSSANNYSRIYLMADTSLRGDGVDGYFLQIGGSDDSLTFCRQQGNLITNLLVLNGVSTDASTNQMSVKVCWDTNGRWHFYSDENAGDYYQFRGEVFDTVVQDMNYFGVYCKYTSSNSTKFYFDDFYAGKQVIDTLPPYITSVEIIPPSDLMLIFSENILADSCLSAGNFNIVPGLGQSVGVFSIPENPAELLVSFSSVFQEETAYTLQAMNIMDLNGNVSDTIHYPFSYYRIKPYDILIHEIMADPEPLQGLPPYEYIELYNHSLYEISLEGWTFCYSSYSKTFGEVCIPADSFLVLTHSDAIPLFDEGIHTYGLFSSTSSLSNEGTTLVLRDDSGSVMHALEYSADWYTSSIKKDGGWSLEMADPLNPCGQAENWFESVDFSGGTPGWRNSVSTSLPDVDSPYLKGVGVSDSWNIMLYFNEPLDSLSVHKKENFNIYPGIGNPLIVEGSPPFYNDVKLTLPQALQSDTLYLVNIKDSITDCCGNHLAKEISDSFMIPAICLPGDIVINELLYDPYPASHDFIELFNYSEKVIDLRNLILAEQDDDGNASSFTALTSDYFLFFPREYVLITSNLSGIIPYYSAGDKRNIIELNSFPDFPNGEGDVLLLDNNQQIIDHFKYSDNLHDPLLYSTEGVSLEKIYPGLSSAAASSWHSAASSVNYATPGYRNSQYLHSGTTGDLKTEPAVFSPDNDGMDDVTQIYYQLPAGEYHVSIHIFDAFGRLIKILADNELSGREGSFLWNGLDECGQHIATGIYVVYLYAFHASEPDLRMKETVVLGRKLNR